MTDFAGWELPLRFGSDLAEHAAVRTAAGLFDLSHMAQLRLTGPGAGQGLDWALTASHSDMPVGRASYSLLLASDGGAIDDLIVDRLGGAEYLVIANAANREVVVEELTQRLEPFEADLRDVTLERTLIAVQGPRSAAILVDAGMEGPARDLSYYTAAPATFAGIEFLVARTGYTGEDGFEIAAPAESAEILWLALEAAGGPYGLVPAGLAARDTLRLEAAMPLYGHELTRQTTPWEAGLGRFVALDKPDFFGRRALVADDGTRRPRRRRLVGLAGTGRRAARAGYGVLDPATDAPIGEVTSGVLSPTLGYPIAMAYLGMEHGAETGAEVMADVRGTPSQFTVVRRPFYRRAADPRELG
jgi:aminomethyltransferase